MFVTFLKKMYINLRGRFFFFFQNKMSATPDNIYKVKLRNKINNTSV